MPDSWGRSQPPRSRRWAAASKAPRGLSPIPEYPSDPYTYQRRTPSAPARDGHPGQGAFLNPRPVPIRPGIETRQMPDSPGSPDSRDSAGQTPEPSEIGTSHSYDSDGPFDRLRKEVTRSAKGLLPGWGKGTRKTGTGAPQKSSPLRRPKAERNVLRKPPQPQLAEAAAQRKGSKRR
ncbi:hypothetical protein GCM10009863_44290 [Streptomyces axinellae]|uniref:Uncharacterized protein n=1 Tax=Streptomyces axinellae TaxID=552788 RepID=A0ABP6CRU8_9ACTN